MTAPRACALALSILFVGAARPHSAAGEADPAPRYGEAMKHELAAMGVDAHCTPLSPTRMRCDYAARSSATQRAFQAHAVYDDETDTIYFYVARYLVAPAHDASTPTLLRRLMELNWSLLVGKFEWNPRDGEVRLSAVLSTDSNFDRRAFRSTMLALDTTAARYHEELSALLAPPGTDPPRASEVRERGPGQLDAPTDGR